MPALKNVRHEAFAQAYFACQDVLRAARTAGYTGTDATATRSGYHCKEREDVQERLAELAAEQAKRLESAFGADQIVQRWIDTATADPNDLTQYRIGACRFCHGEDHAYQWRTEREFNQAHNDWWAKNRKRKDEERDPEPDAAGGTGYRMTRDPHPDCPECDGLGIGYVRFNDTTKLTPQAKTLFQGVRVTQAGAEIIMADQQKAIENLAKRLGVLKEPVEVDAGNSLTRLLQQIIDRKPVLKPNPTAALPSTPRPPSPSADGGGA